MTENKTKVQPIITYIDKLAELYSKKTKIKNELSERATDELATELDKINEEIDTYRAENGNKKATFSDVEEAFAYQVNTLAFLNTNTAQMVQSQLQVLLNLLKQNGTLTNSAYESIAKQYRAIVRDYHMEEK